MLFFIHGDLLQPDWQAENHCRALQRSVQCRRTLPVFILKGRYWQAYSRPTYAVKHKKKTRLSSGKDCRKLNGVVPERFYLVGTVLVLLQFLKKAKNRSPLSPEPRGHAQPRCLAWEEETAAWFCLSLPLCPSSGWGFHAHFSRQLLQCRVFGED